MASLLGKLKIAGGLALVFTMSSVPPAPPPPPEPQYKSLLDQIPPRIQPFNATRPRMKDEIATSYAYLQKTCPAMAKVDIKSPWNLADWMNKNICAEEWKKTPYSFRMNSFRAVAVQNNTKTKTELLGKIYDVLPSHPHFELFVDERLKVLHEKLRNDPILKNYRESWEWTQNKDSRLKKYFARIGELTVTTILPVKDFVGPEVHIDRQANGRYGVASFDGKQISFTVTENGGIGSATHAERTGVHEFFHIVEVIIRNWYAENKLENSVALSDMGEKFFYSWYPGLAMVSPADDRETYKNTFLERWSYYAMNAANKSEDFHLKTEQDEWNGNNLVNEDGRFRENGILPAACNLK